MHQGFVSSILKIERFLQEFFHHICGILQDRSFNPLGPYFTLRFLILYNMLELGFLQFQNIAMI